MKWDIVGLAAMIVVVAHVLLGMSVFASGFALYYFTEPWGICF